VSVPRAASRPPQLPGFDYVRNLGLGGFADVFLYRQHLPSRLVAVKVLLAAGLSDGVRAQFTDEANLMARLSHHPSIVTVHHASVAADGRPYLVMEYCSQPGLAQRYRAERMGVAEVLRIGVRLAAAVETAHRAGVLHRDIKPSNVLVTDFGWPALTDFGIAATVGLHGAAGAAAGLSVPWAPPEMLAEPPTADERSDVYCLAATLYSLLAGRSPFEVPGGVNGAAELITRIERDPVPAIGRPDVPDGLRRLLTRAMAKHPDERHPSALALGRALQQVEAELGLPPTTLDLPGEAAGPGRAPDSDDSTRERRVREISADSTRPRAPVEVPPSNPARVVTDGTDVARVTSHQSLQPHQSQLGRARTVGAAAVVVVAAGGLVAAFLSGRDAQPPLGDPGLVHETLPPAVAVPAPRALAGARATDGSVRFTWDNPAPEQGDRYRWGVVTATGEERLATTGERAAAVPAGQAPGEVCVQVFLVRSDGRVSSDAARGCAG